MRDTRSARDPVARATPLQAPLARCYWSDLGKDTVGTPRSSSGARRWTRTAGTRQAFLDAARAVFTVHGFADTPVAEVVARAGSSNGSLYHHFGGKNELFLALWEDHQQQQEKQAARAVAEARERGERDPMTLFVEGARGFLKGNWVNRDLSRLFFDGDAPPGFELARRRRTREWIRQNAVLLRTEDVPFDRVVVLILTTVAGEAGREVANCETEDEAYTLIDEVLRFVRRLSPHSS